MYVIHALNCYIFEGEMFELKVGITLRMARSISCLDRCNHHEIHTCQCDAQCEVFGDCCADFQTHCQVNIALEEIDYQKNLSVCTAVYHKNKAEVAYLISKCPPTWSEPIIRYRCSSHSINMHVYDKDGYNYRNIYCALCNNRTIADISFWDIASDADLAEECKTDLFSDNSVIKSRTFSLRGKIFRICYDSDRCPQAFVNASIMNACSSYLYPVYTCWSGIVAFKNPHCAICRGYKVKELKQTCLQYSFLGADMWNFRSAEQSAALFTRICPVGEVFDEISRTCRPIFCAKGYSLVFDKCSLDTNIKTVDDVSTWNCDEEMTFIIFKSFLTNRSCVVDTFKLHLNGYDLIIFTQQASQFDEDLWTALKFNNKISGKTLHTIIIRDDSSSNIINDLRNCNLNEIEIISVCSRNNYECGGQWISGSPSEFRLVNGVSNNTNVYLKRALKTTMYFSPEIIIYTLIHDFQYPNQNSYEEMLFCAHVIDVPFLNCAMIKLRKGEYSFNNSGLYYMDKKLKTGEYIILPNGHVQVCLSVILQSSKTSTSYSFLSGTLDAVHFSLSSLSVLGLVGTLVTYVRFKNLRNLHGVGIISLSLALLFANILTVLSDKIPLSGSVCIAFAATTHFFWLAAFTWMTLISVIMIDAFVVNRTKLIHKSVKAVSVILLTGWSTPLLIVLMFLFLQFCKSCFSSDIIIYNGLSTCWLATPSVNLYAFGIPVVLSLTINLALLTTTLVSVHMARRKSNLLQHKRENEDSWKEALLFLKVSCH